MTSLIDTNVLIRFLTNDRKPKYKTLYAFFNSLEKGEIKAELKLIVLFQTIFVLKSYYEVPKNRIAKALIAILKFKGIRIKEIAGPFSRKQGKLPSEFTQYYLFTFDVPDRIAAAMLDALTRNGAPETEKPRLLSRGKATGAVSRWLKLADALGILSSLGTDQNGSRDNQVAKVLESLISAHAMRRIRGVVDRIVEEFAKEKAIDMTSLCGLLLRRMTADGFEIEDRKGRKKNLSLCTVTRVVPGERLEVAIDSGPGSPTAFEVLSAVLSRELVPLVRVVRLSTKYRLNGELLDIVQVVSKKSLANE